MKANLLRMILSAFAALVLASCAEHQEPLPPPGSAVSSAKVSHPSPLVASSLASSNLSGPSLLARHGLRPSAQQDPYVPYGTPQATSPEEDFIVLQNTGFEDGYSESRRDPVWAAYHISSKMPQGEDHKPRPGSFKTDYRTTAQATQAAYKQVSNEFDRGHMAPNHAIDKFYGKQGQLDTFSMSNIVPQRPCFNEQTWQELEGDIADRLVYNFDDLWVIVGPIFSSNPRKLSQGIEVPDALFCVIVGTKNNSPQVLCLIEPQNSKGSHSLSEYKVDLSDIEEATHLNLLPELSEQQKELVQKNLSPDWNLDQMLYPKFACRLGSADEEANLDH